MNKYLNSKDFKKWESDENNNKSAYICLNCGDLFIYDKKFNIWVCSKCGLVTTKENLIKNHTRVY